MTRVCLITPGELFGGVERQVLDLVRAFADDPQYELEVLLFHDEGLARELRSTGCEPVILARGSYDPRTPRDLDSILTDLRSDVVHLHGYRGTVSLVLGKARHGLGIVKTEHGLPEIQGRPSRATLKLWLNARLDAWATRRLDPAICYVTRDLHDRCEHVHRGLRRDTVPNGITPLARAEYDRPDDLPAGAVNLGIVGRITRVKGIEHAFHALLCDDMPPSVHLAVIGDGPLTPELRELAARLDLRDRIHFLGFQKEIYGYLAHLDGLLMPSLHEGLPYTLLEAMSLGLPVLAAAVGGLREVIKHERTGLLFPPADPQAIASACGIITADGEGFRRLGRAAAEQQRRSYTREVMVDAYRRHYLQEARRDRS